jgi:hypothetical protein
MILEEDKILAASKPDRSRAGQLYLSIGGRFSLLITSGTLHWEEPNHILNALYIEDGIIRR